MGLLIFLFLVDAALGSGSPEQEADIVRLTDTGARNRTPVWSPSGRRIAFGSNRTGEWQVWLTSSDGSDQVQLTDLPEPIGGPSWSADGRTIWFESGLSIHQLRMPSRQVEQFVVPHERTYRPVPSPDGTHLLFDVAVGTNHDIWVIDLAAPDRQGRQLTSDPGYDSDARWSPEGRRVVFHSDRGAEQFHTQIFTMFSDGSSVAQLTTGPSRNAYPAWSPNGRCILYTSESQGNRDIWLMDHTGAEKRRLTTYTGFDGEPGWAPQGGWILFSTARWGGEELALMRVQPTDVEKCEA